MTEPVLIARDVTKVFRTGKQEVRALRGVSLQIAAGEFLALVGPSGSGKTTLLNLVGALDVPTSGELIVLGKHIAELSGGQQQRVAVARAVAARPALVLADEPTANLDGENAEVLMHLMRDLRDRHGMTFVFSTHDPRVVAHAVRVVTLVDGRVARDERTAGEQPHAIVPGVDRPTGSAHG